VSKGVEKAVDKVLAESAEFEWIGETRRAVLEAHDSVMAAVKTFPPAALQRHRGIVSELRAMGQRLFEILSVLD